MSETNFRALCAELVDKIEGMVPFGPDEEHLTNRAIAALAQPEQYDKTLKSIRETTPRYRMSVIVSTNDSAIDTRMNVIWQALDLSKEILESVSLPEQLPPLGNQ
jgi:hypothetical protein